MEKKRIKITGIVMLIAIVFVLAILAQLNFFSKTKCSEEGCFRSSLVACNRAVYQSEEEEATWLYEVKGESKEGCLVKVKLLYLKKGTVDMESLAEKEMTCEVPLETYLKPQDNLEYCHGELKEEIQSLLIKKMHDYIIKNLRQISAELNKTV